MAKVTSVRWLICLPGPLVLVYRYPCDVEMWLWQLAVGGWRLAAGGWRWQVASERPGQRQRQEAKRPEKPKKQKKPKKPKSAGEQQCSNCNKEQKA